MEQKIGVFICTGYGIEASLDVEALCKVATGEYKVPFCKTVASCEGKGLEEILRDIRDEELSKVLIAGISARAYSAPVFPCGIIVENLPLRELVVLPQPPQEEDTQMMAEDYLRMYIAKLQKMDVPTPFEPEETLDKSLLVVGGGVAGLTAALEAANTGYEVRLAEREAQLGGWLAKLHKSVPTKAPYHELEDTGAEALIKTVQEHPGITVYTSATPGKIAGAPGLFDVSLVSPENGEEVAAFRAGAIIQATGWKPKEPEKVEHLGYGAIPDVIRNVELEEMMKKTGKITRPSDGKEAKNVAFIQWAGSPDKEVFSHCSAVMDLTSLKQAVYVRQQDPEAKAYIFYDFLRAPGQFEDFYRNVQEDPGIFLTKGDVTKVEQENGAMLLTAQDTMLAKAIQVPVDLVVLATGMVPNSADGEAIRAYEDAKVAAEKGDSDVQRKAAAEKAEQLKAHEGTEILNLQYRQGPDLPVLEYGYPDSHFICFPYETRRTGIYAAGCVRQPMDAIESREDATGAALKAIQCVEMTSRGEAVHPRAGDNSYPEFNLQKCTQCKRCTEECPFGAINEDEKGTPQRWATRCRRCGVCMGACPRAHRLVQGLLGRHDRRYDQGGRGAGRRRRKTAHPGLPLRERRFSGPRAGGAARLEIHPLRACHSASLPGLDEYRVDQRSAFGRLRRRHPHRLQIRRRLPVPLHQGQRTRRNARRQRPREAAADGARRRARRAAPVADFRIRAASPKSSTISPK